MTEAPSRARVRKKGCTVSTDAVRTDQERAERHAAEAERLLERRWISAYIKAQAHATLALYYARHRL